MTFRRHARTLHAVCLVAATVLAAGCGSVGGGNPRLTPPPATLPATALAPSDALLGGSDFSVNDPNLDWGVGVLRPSGGTDPFRNIDLPLFESPGGAHWAWATRGRIYDIRRNVAFAERSDATVLVSGVQSFIVLEQRGDGWARIRYGHNDDPGRGVAWTRPDWAAGRRAEFISWGDALRGAQGLVFRNAQVAHNLRAGPGTAEGIVEVLEGGDFDMRALELRGDWMRVRVFTPPACVGAAALDQLLGGQESASREGWIAWRSDERGPWVVSAATERCGASA